MTWSFRSTSLALACSDKDRSQAASSPVERPHRQYGAEVHENWRPQFSSSGFLDVGLAMMPSSYSQTTLMPSYHPCPLTLPLSGSPAPPTAYSPGCQSDLHARAAMAWKGKMERCWSLLCLPDLWSLVQGRRSLKPVSESLPCSEPQLYLGPLEITAFFPQFRLSHPDSSHHNTLSVLISYTIS